MHIISCMFLFFFSSRRRHTRSKRDWSSDVCSSDLSTGIFMAATVLTQIFTPWMLRKFGYRRLMAVSAFMLGVPALGHIFGTEAWAVLLFSALRGTGFGALTVAESALMAEL